MDKILSIGFSAMYTVTNGETQSFSPVDGAHGTMYFPLILIVIIMVIYIPYLMKHMKKKKEEQEAYLLANPDAAKVFTKIGIASLYSSEAITVLGVNGQPPVPFYDGLQEGQGFFLPPGQNIIEVIYARTRAGILHKTVTTRTGPSKQEVAAEPRKRYRLGYDRKGEGYVFEELQG